jgi:hypothetical protein
MGFISKDFLLACVTTKSAVLFEKLSITCVFVISLRKLFRRIPHRCRGLKSGFENESA